MRRLLFALCCLATPAIADMSADVIFLGEIHDNPDAHLGQAAEIVAIAPTAVVFEMLTPAQAAAANDVPLDQIAAATQWADSGWPDYALYAPIFEALGSAEIYGAGTKRDAAMAIFQDGAAAAFGDDAATYGLTAPLPAPEQAAREDLQFTAHCEAMPRNMMAGMVEVQRFRDATLARTAQAAIDTHGPPVVVVTGAGHARKDWGAPALLTRAHPNTRVSVKAFVEADSGLPFDEVVIVPEAEREDPCQALVGDDAAVDAPPAQ